MLIWHSPVTEISKYMLKIILQLHVVIDKIIYNNNAKDGMIHGIDSFLITWPSNPST